METFTTILSVATLIANLVAIYFWIKFIKSQKEKEEK